jgi:hypothetical protein
MQTIPNYALVITVLAVSGILTYMLGNFHLKPEHREKVHMYFLAPFTFQDVLTKRGNILRTIGVVLISCAILGLVICPGVCD